MKRIDLTGKTFNRLTVVKYLYTIKPQGMPIWECICSCGKTVNVRSNDLLTGNTGSCGCLQIDKTTKHKKINTREYKIWTQMKSRCSNPNQPSYIRYGERGITVCDEWLDFKNFYRDMGDSPIGTSIERIDNNKGYYKENCKWATITEQNNNTRATQWFIYNGKRQPLSFLAKEHNIKRETLYARVVLLGWELNKGLTTPQIVKNR